MRPAGQAVTLNAKEHLPSDHLGGGSSTQLYTVTENDNTYCVKFKGNPQGTRILFNEYLCGRIGEFLQLPMSEAVMVNVGDALIPRHSPRLPNPFPGTQFGTRFHIDGQTDQTALRASNNFGQFCGVVVYDTFINNTDSRQYLVYPANGVPGTARDTAAIFDQGHALGHLWTVASLAQTQDQLLVRDTLNIKGDYGEHGPYEVYLGRLEAIPRDVFEGVVQEAPLHEWDITQDEGNAIVGWLDHRKVLVRAAIAAYLH
jgi:hypothetical protein